MTPPVPNEWSDPVEPSADAQDPSEPKPLWWRWQMVIAGLAVAVALLSPFIAHVLAERRGIGSETPGTVNSSAGQGTSVPVSTGLARSLESSTTSSGDGGGRAPQASGPVLGRQVVLTSTQPCGKPSVSGGAEWSAGSFRVGGREFSMAYACSLGAGESGHLEFELGKRFEVVTITAGFDDRYSSATHRVRYEVKGDDAYRLVPLVELGFGENKTFEVDVSGITRLTLSVIEVGEAADPQKASRPIWAGLELR